MTISARSLVGYLAFAALAVVYWVWGASPVLGDFGGDNAFYLFTAEYFSPYRERTALAEQFARHSVFPPLYPWLLAVTGGAEDLRRAHLVTVAFAALGFGLFYRWLRSLLIAPFVAGILVLAFAITPGLYLEALLIHSEPLYLCLTFAALWTAARHEAGSHGGWLWGGAVLIGAACLARSAGIALLAAYWLYLLRLRAPSFAALGLAAALPMVLWRLVAPSHESYLAQLAERLGDDPVHNSIEIVTTQVGALVRGWSGNFEPLMHGRWIMRGLGALGLIGAAARAWQGRLDGYYSVAYIGLMLLWPFPAESMRFAVVITPVLAGQAVWLLDSIAKHSGVFKQPAWLGGGLGAAWLLLMLPTLAVNASRFLAPLPPELEAYRRQPDWYEYPQRDQSFEALKHARWMEQAMREAGERVPVDDCVYNIKGAIFSYHSRRMSGGLPGSAVPQEEFLSKLHESGCRYVYLLPFGSPTYGQPLYPGNRLSDAQVEEIYVSRPAGDQSLPVGVLLKLKPPIAPEEKR